MLPAGFTNSDQGTDKVKSTKHARTGVNHAILTKWIKLQLEVKLASNLKIMENVGFEQTFMKFIELFVL